MYSVVTGVCFFSSRRRHTRCALVTGVQTCALPILRLKGWCRIAGTAQPLLLQMTGARWTLSADAAPPALLSDQSLLVGLGTTALPDDHRMTALFDAACTANAVGVAVA